MVSSIAKYNRNWLLESVAKRNREHCPLIEAHEGAQCMGLQQAIEQSCRFSECRLNPSMAMKAICEGFARARTQRCLEACVPQLGPHSLCRQILRQTGIDHLVAVFPSVQARADNRLLFFYVPENLCKSVTCVISCLRDGRTRRRGRRRI